MEVQHPPGSPFWCTAGGLAAVGFGAVAAFFLVTEHQAHLFGVLPPRMSPYDDVHAPRATWPIMTTRPGNGIGSVPKTGRRHEPR